MKALLALSFVALLAGCVSTPPAEAWHHPQHGLDQTRTNLANCKLEALQQRRQSFNMRPDGDEDRREQRYIRACMEAKGYTLK